MKLIKYIIKGTFSLLKLVQFLLFMLAGLTTIYFILSTLQYNLPATANDFFRTIYEIQKSIFAPNWIHVANVDFTLILFTLEVIVFSFLLFFAEDFVLSLEKSFYRVQMYNRRENEKKFNKKLSKNIKKDLKQKDIKLVGAYNIILKNAGLVRIENEILEDATLKYNLKLGKLLKQSFNVDFRRDNNLFIISTEDFKNVDEILDTIYKYGISAKADAKKNNYYLEIYSAISITDKKDTFADFIPVLKKLMELSSANKTTTKADFKLEYEALSKQSFDFSSMGNYFIADKMEEIFYTERKQ